MNRRLIRLAESPDIRFWRVDYDQLSAPERVFGAIWELESEVNNGGSAFAGEAGHPAAKKDHAVHPELQRFFAKHMGATCHETDSSHVPMLSNPSLVIDVIRKAA